MPLKVQMETVKNMRKGIEKLEKKHSGELEKWCKKYQQSSL